MVIGRLSPGAIQLFMNRPRLINRPGRTLGSVCLTVVAAVWSSQPSAATPPVTPAPTDSSVAVAVPRSVTYAGTEWTIDGAVWAPGDDVVAPSVRLGFRVVNRLEQYGLTVPVELLAIETPDGGLVRGTRLEGTPSEYRVELDSGTTATGTAVFELAPRTGVVDVAQLSFVIDEPGRTPASLPLAGPVPPDPYPLAVAVTGTSGPSPARAPTAPSNSSPSERSSTSTLVHSGSTRAAGS